MCLIVCEMIAHRSDRNTPSPDVLVQFCSILVVINIVLKLLHLDAAVTCQPIIDQ